MREALAAARSARAKSSREARGKFLASTKSQPNYSRLDMSSPVLCGHQRERYASELTADGLVRLERPARLVRHLQRELA